MLAEKVITQLLSLDLLPFAVMAPKLSFTIHAATSFKRFF